MSVCALNLALYGLQVKFFGVTMCHKNKAKKPKVKRGKRVSRHPRKLTASPRILYIFLILFGALVLGGIALFLRIDTPFVWVFLSGIGNWLALTILARNLR